MPTPGPDPILIRIVNDVEKALSLVAPPLYPVTLVTDRPTQLKPSIAEGRCTVELGNAERAPMTDTSNGTIRWHQQLLVTVCTLIPDDNTMPFDQMFAWYVAAIEKALLADTSRGGIAIDTIPEGSILDYTPDGAAWIQSRFTLDYFTLYGDPWSQ